MVRVMLGLCCFVAAGSEGTSAGWLVILSITGVALLVSGNKAIADREGEDNGHL